jgi:hypothetical protein
MERTSYAGPVLKGQVTKKEVKEYFNERYSYIAFEISDKDLDKFLSQQHMLGKSIEYVSNLLYDKLLSEGDAEVQE